MKRLICIALILTVSSFCSSLKAQCLQIESILVDACVSGGGCSSTSGPCSCEGRNEMVLFKVLGTAINTTSLTPTWPNNSFRGWKQNLNTAADVASLNATIIKCGFLKEPVGNILPANSEVLIITSWDMCTGANSFANLQDTLIVLFQDTNNFQGHFVNQNNGGTVSSVPVGPVLNRTLTLSYPPLACSQSVTYHPHLLVNNMGTYGGSSGQNDGATVLFDALGNATYVNNGCRAPYIPTTVTVTAPSTVCVNSTAIISAAITGSVANYTWTTSGTGTLSVPTGTLSSGSSTVTTIYTPGAGESGVVTFTVQVQGKCILAVTTNTVSINVIALPAPIISSSGGAVICNGNSTVLSVNNQAGVGYTWNPGAGSGTTFTVSPGVQTIYTLTATNACASVNATFTVDVNALPTLSVTTASVCPGFTTSITASGATTYTWNTGAQGAVFSANPNSTTQYTVTGTDGNGCVNTSTAQIFVYALPVITTNTPSTCPGGTVTLTASGASTYSWSTSQSGTSISVSPAVTTSYTVIGTDANGCINSTVATATIFNQPNVSSNNSTICPGNTTTITVTGAVTYTWSTGSNNTSISVTPAINTTYTVIGTDNNGCKDTTTATVTIVNTLTVTASTANASICNGSSTTLTGNGASTYTWSPAGSLSSSTGVTVTASPTVNTTYTVIGSSGSCADTNVVTINVNSLPTVTATSGTICVGNSTVLNANGASTYTWSPATGLSSSTGSSVTANPATSSSYTVTGTGGNGCMNTTVVSVVVNPLPILTVNSPGICPGATATLTANGATTYTWNTTQTGNTISVSPAAATNYTVVGTDVNGCMNFTVASVTINPLPNITVNSPATCQGTNTTLTAGGGVSYSWSTSQSGTSITVPGTAASYTVTGTDANGCTNTALANVIILPLPVAQTVTGMQVICEGQSTTLAISPGGTYTYTWSGPSGNLGNAATATANQTGVYTVTTSNACGSVTSTFSLTISLPEAAFTPNPGGGQAPVTITYSNTSTGVQLANYWNFANGDTSHQLNPTETYTAAGSYAAVLIVTDMYGCMDTASYSIVVSDVPSVVIIPNVFSPNGDNINDVFSITAAGITSFNCKVYDRWGLALYEWSNLNGGWDGKNASNGIAVSDGTYYFLITYVDSKNKTVNKPGFLQLVK